MDSIVHIFSYLTHISQHAIDFIYANSQNAHWIIFGALMLAGFNVPISEDLMLITSGILASTVVPENATKLFVCVFLGCYLSDWVAYWIGRLLGPKLWRIKWFSKMISVERYGQMQGFYTKYGFYVLLVGRFIPFGVRNALFLTAGMMKMNFGKFIVSDGIACLISNSTIFYLAYTIGKNRQVLMDKIENFNQGIFIVFIAAVVAALGCFLFRNSKKNTAQQ